MNWNTRLLLAAAIAGIGVVLVWRSLSSIPRPGAHAVAAPPSPALTSALGDVDFDTQPDEQTVEELGLRVGRTASELAGSLATALPSSIAQADFADAVASQLSTVLAGDYEAHKAFLRARGDTSEGGETERGAWEAAAAGVHLAPVDERSTSVRWVIRAGKPVGESMTHQGFGVLTTTPEAGRFPVPKEGSPALNVIEVSLPMRKATLEGKSVAVLTAFQFVWNPDRRQWVPWRNVVYKDPNDAHTALPF